MQDDVRCCGSGHCVIDETGRCWCGQQWNGVQMCAPKTSEPVEGTAAQVLGDVPHAQAPALQ